MNFYVSESCHGFTTTIFIFNEKDWFFIASYDEFCEENTIVEKWWDLLTGFIRESLSTQKISYPINAIVY